MAASGFTFAGGGHTALTAEEEADLIPNLSTKQELNEWERQNIVVAYSWALERKGLLRRDPLTEPYLRLLHHRMFDQTWKWAGIYRTSQKNIGVPHHRIRDAVAVLLGDARYWLEHATYSPDEAAVRFHHRLVSIHPFCNGNGRHARLVAGVLARRQGRPVPTWGSKSALSPSQLRKSYIDALRAADGDDMQPLLAFARS